MVLFSWRKLIGLALILMIAFPLGAFAAEKKETGHKKSVSRSSAKNKPQKPYRSSKVCNPSVGNSHKKSVQRSAAKNVQRKVNQSRKVCKPLVGNSHKKSVHHSSAKNIQRKSNRSRTDCKLKAKKPKNLAQFSFAKDPKAKGDRPRKVSKPVDKISPPNSVQYSHVKNVQQKKYKPPQVNKPAKYASSPEQMNPDHGSENDVPSSWSTIDKRVEGKINNQEFCTKLTDNVLAAQTANSPDMIKQGYMTKDYPNKNSGYLDKIIMINTPISVASHNN